MQGFPHNSWMKLLRQTHELQRQTQKLRAQFVETELDLALTFCEIALSTRSIERKRNSRAHAIQALQTAQKFAQRIGSSGKIHRVEMDERFQRAADLLTRLDSQLQG